MAEVLQNEEVSNETLISILKDKHKEIKSLEAKKTKLEEKYVKIFKEHKLLLKFKESMIIFLKGIFKEEPYLFVTLIETLPIEE